VLLWTIIKVAFKSLLANKLRSFLAMLGIIVGVGAVISMLALGAGAKKQVMARVTAMGTNLLTIHPGGRRRGGVRSESSNNLIVKDAEAILQKVKGVESVAPVARGRVQVKYFNENLNSAITGVSLSYFSIRNFVVEKGRAFTSVEEDRSARVSILGVDVAKQLFGERDPIDEIIRTKNVNFRVIGVLKAKGEQGWFNPDEMVVIPYTTAMKQILGQDHLNEINVKAEQRADLELVMEDITQLLRYRHRIRPDGEDDFHLHNRAEIVEMASSFTQTFAILLGGIASISLIVGGIGIMNIMLVTVTERIKEIGVRKAIGARNRDILRQFLVESIIISGLGGLFGMLLGYGVADAIRRLTEHQTVVEIYSIILALAVSAFVGIFFGYYPARRAAMLDPIEALRYE
jgi:putative ABC transport system permease protein